MKTVYCPTCRSRQPVKDGIVLRCRKCNALLIRNRNYFSGMSRWRALARLFGECA